MEEGAYVVELVAELLYLPAAAYLLRIAARTGRLPERLLGWSFACMGGSYFLYMVPSALSLEAETPWYLLGRVVYGIACMLMAVFTRRVFRSTVRWAGVLTGACILGLAGGVLIACFTGDPGGLSLENPGFWIEWWAETLPYVWLTAEAFLARARTRRRLRLGLSDPHLCNRFLLWGLFGVLQLGAAVVMVPLYAAYTLVGSFTSVMDVILGGFEIASVVMIWLAFSPPPPYRRWIELLALAPPGAGAFWAAARARRSAWRVGRGGGRPLSP